MPGAPGLVEYKNQPAIPPEVQMTPTFITYGGYEYSESDYSYVGWVGKSMQQYYVPDTLTWLDSADFIARSLKLKYTNPGKYIRHTEEGTILGFDSDGFPLKYSDDSCRTMASDLLDEIIDYCNLHDNIGY